MVKTIITITLTLAMLTAASAQQVYEHTIKFECGAVRSIPSDHDRYPIYKIELGVTYTYNNNSIRIRHFSVKHYDVTGVVYSREDQYRDRQFWFGRIGHLDEDEQEQPDENWSGVSIRKPSLTMIGTFRRKMHYVEKLFRNGRLETTIDSRCYLTSPVSAKLPADW